MSVATAVAESYHHAAPRGQKMARAGREVRVVAHGEDPEALPSQPELFELSFDEEPGASAA